MGCNCNNNKSTHTKNIIEKATKKATNIIEGWTNLIMNKNKNEAFLERRAKICFLCRERSSINICKICSCYIPAKINVKSEECPKKMWLKV